MWRGGILIKLTVAYYRSSTDLQENSITMQMDQAKDYALEHVISIDCHYTDEAVSARKNSVLNRPMMNQLIQEIRLGKVGTILVYKRDRLARNAIEYMEFYRLCRNHNVQILFTAKNEFPVYYTPLGEFIELIMSGMVQHEAEQIADRIRATHIANFKNEIKAGVLPYGAKAVQNGQKVNVTLDPVLKSDVGRIFNAFLEQNFPSLKDFVTYINEELGILRMPSNRKKRKQRSDEDTSDEPRQQEPKVPGPWKESEVVNLLTNPLFMGMHRRQFGDQTIEVPRPECAVVSPKEWEEVQRRLQSFLPVSREYPDFPFLLDDLMVCSLCKRPLVSRFHWHADTATATYDCRHTKKERGGGKLAHKAFSISAESIHDIVFGVVRNHIEQLLENHMDDLFNRAKNARRLELQKQIQQLQTDIHQIEAEFRSCVSEELATTGRLADREQLAWLVEKKRQLAKQQERLREKVHERDDYTLLPHLYSRRHEVLVALQDNLAEWSKKDPRQLRAIYADIIDKVVVSPNELTIFLKHPFLMPHEEVKPIGLKRVHSKKG